VTVVDHAARILGRAQDSLTAAAQRAASAVLSGREGLALETRRAQLKTRLQEAVSEAGQLAYQRWKCPSAALDAQLASLCRQIDDMNAEYHAVLAEIGDCRASASSLPRMLTGRTSPAPRAGIGDSPALPVAAPVGSPVTPLIHPYGGPPQGGYVAAVPVAVATGRIATCPECLTDFDDSAHFCPSCGMRV
jgi:hypothetical protein